MNNQNGNSPDKSVYDGLRKVSRRISHALREQEYGRIICKKKVPVINLVQKQLFGHPSFLISLYFKFSSIRGCIFPHCTQQINGEDHQCFRIDSK